MRWVGIQFTYLRNWMGQTELVTSQLFPNDHEEMCRMLGLELLSSQQEPMKSINDNRENRREDVKVLLLNPRSSENSLYLSISWTRVAEILC